MKKLALLFLSASLLSSPAFADEDKVVATYKGGEVKESQVMQQFKPALDAQQTSKDKKFAELDPKLQEALVRGFINIKLLEQEAKNAGIENSKEFQDRMNNIKGQLIQQELVERYVKSVVTDKIVDEEYSKLVASLKGKEEVKVSHILLDSEEKAKEVKKKISKDGSNFAKLAKENTKDDGSKASGGDIGYIMQGQLVPEFEQKAFAMKVNEISEPVKTQFGWHIIKVQDKRAAKAPSKEEAKSALTSKLSREAMEKYLEDLASKADIKLNFDVKPKAVPEAAKPAEGGAAAPAGGADTKKEAK